MKKLLVILLYTCSAFAESLVVYNPDDLIVPNRVTTYRRTGDQSAYLSDPNDLTSVTGPYVVNADLSAVTGVPTIYWKYSSGLIVEMTQAEKDAIIADAAYQSYLSEISTVESLNVSTQELVTAWEELYPEVKNEIIGQIKVDRGLE